jgi:hypothetical protein
VSKVFKGFADGFADAAGPLKMPRWMRRSVGVLLAAILVAETVGLVYPHL